MAQHLRIKTHAIVIDCADAQELSEFYARLLGCKKNADNSEWISVGNWGESPILLFQEVSGYSPPVWPDEAGMQRQMMHIDFAVNDKEAAICHALACGATLAPTQYSEQWAVMLDPAGHPFCLCPKEWM